jgi:hypothetical protein
MSRPRPLAVWKLTDVPEPMLTIYQVGISANPKHITSRARYDSYQSCNHESIVDFDAPLQRPLRDQPCKHSQRRRNQEDPSNNVYERPEVITRSRLPRKDMVRKNKRRQYRHRIVGGSESLQTSVQRMLRLWSMDIGRRADTEKPNAQ